MSAGGATRRLLILGGTGDAKQLTQWLIAEQAARLAPLEIIYSVAGLVRIPALDCEVVSGGFTQFGGLAAFIGERQIDAVLDCTHPYALVMSQHAVSAAQQAGIPCWRLERAVWQPKAGDDWQSFASWQALLEQITQYRSVFISSGQLSAETVGLWQQKLQGQQKLQVAGKSNPPQQQLLRTAVAPTFELPAGMDWLKAIGPFALSDELALMGERAVDCLISKNSGGQATQAKLEAARILGVPVLMLERPTLPACELSFDSVSTAQTHLTNTYL